MEAELVSATVKRLRNAQRIVVKVGTSLVTTEDGVACIERLQSIVQSITATKSHGRQIVLVSSGAIGLGRARLGLSRMRLGDLVLKQTCAAVGQSLLMRLYEDLFTSRGVKTAQVLLTEDDFTDRRRYSNLRHTLERLLKLGVVPIVNENDTVSTVELEYLDVGGKRIFSDNDRLAALIMSKLEANALILLTNVDGLMSENSTIPLVTDLNSDLKSLAGGPSVNGRGGMVTKLDAIEIAMRAGGLAVIANGGTPDILDKILAGDLVGTTFLSDQRLGGKRRWIKYAGRVNGKLVINAGARKAIVEGKASLLSSGVIRVEDKFKALDVISIADADGNGFARGIANYPSHEAEAMIAASSSSNKRKSAVKPRVLVTRNNIVMND